MCAYANPKITVPARRSVVEKILRDARPDADGCLISPISKTRERPYVIIRGSLTPAVRILIATARQDALRADEDVHHACGKRRCVRLSCLRVMTVDEHVALHIQQRRDAGCARHNRAWDRETPRLSRGVQFHCLVCDRERSSRRAEKKLEYARD